jgi:glycosidase
VLHTRDVCCGINDGTAAGTDDGFQYTVRMANVRKALLPLLSILSLSLSVACATAEGPMAADLADRNGSMDASSTNNRGEDGGAQANVDAGAAPSEPFDVWRRREPIYELYVRHFSAAGNFKGVEAKLPELKALGVGIVWLLPLNEIGSKVPAHGGQAIDAPHGNPYAVKSYERVNAEYGSDGTEASAEADLISLVARAHQLGMHVIVDWVPNHTAWDNPMIESHPDWYARENGAIKRVSAEFPWIAQLDWSKLALRDYMATVMESWIQKFDIDGFRIDYAHSMPRDFFAQLRPRLEKVKPVFLLAEAGAVDFHPTFDMTYDWNVYPLFGEVAHGTKPPSALDDVLLETQLVPYASMPDALVMRMTYNHDDNGKFALADRYRGGIKTFAVLSCTLPGKPLIFDGQEVGMNVFDGQTVRPSINLGHDPAVKIDWSDPDGYRPFYTKLLQLFRANPALHHAGMADFRKIDTVPSAPSYAFVRRDGANTVLVVLNLSGSDLPAVVLAPAPNAGPIAGDYVELFTGEHETLAAGQSMHLTGWDYRVYVQGPTQ